MKKGLIIFSLATLCVTSQAQEGWTLRQCIDYAIEHNIGRALQLADKSAYNYYVDFAEKGYYNRLISGNINQVVHVDSVVCDFATYPYKMRTYARQLIIRESNVTERSLVTSCSLQNTGRSDDNPNGFIIEQFTILENRDIRSAER